MEKKNRNNSVMKAVRLAVLTVFVSVLMLSLTACDSQIQNAALSVIDDTYGNVETSTTETNTSDSSGYEWSEWNPEEAPNFYLVEGKANVEYELSPGEFHFGDLDELGRATACYAVITNDVLMKEKNEEREEFGSSADRISGWGHNEKIDVVYPDGDAKSTWAFARSHLIADSLGGVVDNGCVYNGKNVANNLITGTYAQNVGSDNEGGMAYAETKARDWLETAGADEWLYYCVTPVYEGDEPIARSVFIDMLSSDGEIDEHVEVFNVVGDVSGTYTLDYSTGKIVKNK